MTLHSKAANTKAAAIGFRVLQALLATAALVCSITTQEVDLDSIAVGDPLAAVEIVVTTASTVGSDALNNSDEVTGRANP